MRVDADEDRFDLARFVEAQRPVYERVRLELQQGRKESHWMWFVFPQIGGLGASAMSRRYAIASLEEAKAYLDHPLLGRRLRECVGLVDRAGKPTVEEIFGYPDTLKFCSSMTLFAQVTSGNRVFLDAVERHFGGVFDERTIARLKGEPPRETRS